MLGTGLILAVQVWRPDRWDLPDWLAVIGFPLAFLGLFFGYLQLQQAKEQSEQAEKQSASAAAAANAAKSAIQRTERRLSEIQLLSLLHQLQELRRELDVAVSLGRRQETIRYLGAWVTLASETGGVLAHDGPTGAADLAFELAESIEITGNAKDDIIDRSAAIEPATREIRGRATQICSQGARIVGEMKAFVRPENGGNRG